MLKKKERNRRLKIDFKVGSFAFQKKSLLITSNTNTRFKNLNL